MLISHDHRFIFLKTKKTAGTSIEVSLSRYLGPLDVMTPISSADELLRAQLRIRPRNYVLTEMRYPFVEDERLQFEAIDKVRPRAEAHARFTSHMQADQVRRLVGERVFETYFKFSVERNPLERLISWFFWWIRKKLDLHQARGPHQPEDYRKLFQEFARNLGKQNSTIYTIDHKLCVDRLLRFESLQQGLHEVCNTLGIPYDGWLPRTKSDTRPDYATVEYMFDEPLLDFVKQRYSADFKHYDMSV